MTIEYKNMRLVIRTNDHRPAHVHVLFPGDTLNIIVYLRRPLEIGEIRGKDKARDSRDALEAVQAHYGELRAKWKKLHGRY